MFSGSIVAMVTPMREDHSLDLSAFQELIEWHIAAKTQAIVVAGTTGESAALSGDEHQELIHLAVKQAAKRIPIIAGAGTSSTAATVKLVENARFAGADACLLVTPYYVKPTQKGLYAHYRFVAEKSKGMPLILYNVPGRTACDLLPETIEQLAKIPSIVGIKEATGKMERGREIRERCANTFALYSGDDETALALIQNGANGVISVTANVVPEVMHELCEAALNKEYSLAEAKNQILNLLHQQLFVESNPIPVKWALYKMKKIPLGIRLPLLPLDNAHHQAVKEALWQAGVSIL